MVSCFQMFSQRFSAYCQPLLNNDRRLKSSQCITLQSITCIGQFDQKPPLQVIENLRGKRTRFIKSPLFLDEGIIFHNQTINHHLLVSIFLFPFSGSESLSLHKFSRSELKTVPPLPLITEVLLSKTLFPSAADLNHNQMSGRV